MLCQVVPLIRGSPQTPSCSLSLPTMIYFSQISGWLWLDWGKRLGEASSLLSHSQTCVGRCRKSRRVCLFTCEKLECLVEMPTSCLKPEAFSAKSSVAERSLPIMTKRISHCKPWNWVSHPAFVILSLQWNKFSFPSLSHLLQCLCSGQSWETSLESPQLESPHQKCPAKNSLIVFSSFGITLPADPRVLFVD